MKQSSANTYALYENYDGRYTPHWQYWGVPKVPGCLVNEFGEHLPAAISARRTRQERQAGVLFRQQLHHQHERTGQARYLVGSGNE